MTPALTPTGSDATQPTIKQQTTPAVNHIATDQSTPQMKDFNITKEKRQQLRGLLVNSQPLTPDGAARQRRSKGISLSDDERKTYHAALDEVVRWNTFLTHTDLNLPEVVDFVSYAHNVNEEEHQRALVKAIESHESFKTTLRNNIEDHASALNRAYWNLDEPDNAALTREISSSFSPDKFFAAFAFMKEYLDFEASSPLGKWYAKGMYSNMTRAMV
jgi:hypothetical protein